MEKDLPIKDPAMYRRKDRYAFDDVVFAIVVVPVHCRVVSSGKFTEQ